MSGWLSATSDTLREVGEVGESIEEAANSEAIDLLRINVGLEECSASDMDIVERLEESVVFGPVLVVSMPTEADSQLPLFCATDGDESTSNNLLGSSN